MRVPPLVAALLAGLSGTLAHLALMSAKGALNIMPEFQPYEALQATLSAVAGRELHPIFLWLLSWLNGALLVGFIFARIWAKRLCKRHRLWCSSLAYHGACRLPHDRPWPLWERLWLASHRALGRNATDL
jgi:hypothetical protein